MVLMLVYQHVVCHVKLSIQTRAALELPTIASQDRVQGKSGDRIEPLAPAVPCSVFCVLLLRQPS